MFKKMEKSKDDLVKVYRY